MTAISRILTNPVYLGHMVSGKTVARLYQGSKKRIVPRDQWEIVENVNDPIVDKETYDDVQRLLTEEAEKALSLRGNGRKQKPKNLFKGILRCSECGRIMYSGTIAITPTNIVRYYGCPGYREHKERACEHKATIRDELLKGVVLSFIKSQVKLADEMEVRVEQINASSQRLMQIQNSADERMSLQERVDKLEFYLRSSFENYISGVLNEEDYLFNKAKYEAEILSCRKSIEKLHLEELSISKDDVKANPYVTSMRKFSKARALTREMCVALIDRIDVDMNNVIVITPKYRDEFMELCNQIEKEESGMK